MSKTNRNVYRLPANGMHVTMSSKNKRIFTLASFVGLLFLSPLVALETNVPSLPEISGLDISPSKQTFQETKKNCMLSCFLCQLILQRTSQSIPLAQCEFLFDFIRSTWRRITFFCCSNFFLEMVFFSLSLKDRINILKTSIPLLKSKLILRNSYKFGPIYYTMPSKQ
jgi:hypothetical protein